MADVGWYVPDGRRITYDAATGLFAVGGTSVTSLDMLGYDQVGHVSWASAETQAWFRLYFGQPAGPEPQATKSNSAAPMFIAVAVIIALALGYYGWTKLETERINAGIQQQKIDQKARENTFPYGRPSQTPKNPFLNP